MSEGTITMRQVKYDDGRYGVELTVIGLASEQEAAAAMTYMQNRLCGAEIIETGISEANNMEHQKSVSTLRQLFLTGPNGERLVVSNEAEGQTDGSFRLTVTDPVTKRRWGIVAGITELRPAH